MVFNKNCLFSVEINQSRRYAFLECSEKQMECRSKIRVGMIMRIHRMLSTVMTREYVCVTKTGKPCKLNK